MPSYFIPEKRYRMPVFFGPMPGPRQAPDGRTYPTSMARFHAVTASFLTEASHLERLLPPGFALAGDPVVTVEVAFMSEIAWLAGRGYNTVGVRVPVRYVGKTDDVTAPLLCVLWENLADPILSGREELGFSKLYCEIPPPAIIGERRLFSASWQGHRFLDLEAANIRAADFDPGSSNGLLHYRYIPRVGAPGVADCAAAVHTPAPPRFQLIDHAHADAKVTFHRSTWEQLPTLVHIVNFLGSLPVTEWLPGTISNFYVDVELKGQRQLD